MTKNYKIKKNIKNTLKNSTCTNDFKISKIIVYKKNSKFIFFENDRKI